MEDDFDKSVNTRNVKPTEIAYRNGYVRGQVNSTEQQKYIDQARQENQSDRESNSAASGLITGIILTAIIGFGIAIFFFVHQTQKTPVTSSTPKVEKETKVIEKTTERVREIAPASQPNVEINLPSPAQPSYVVQPSPYVVRPSPTPQPTGTAEPNGQTKSPQPK